MEFNEEDLKKAKKSLYLKIFGVIVLISFMVAFITSSLTYTYALNKFSVLDLKVENSENKKSTETIAKSLERFREVIDKYYKGDINEEDLLDGAIKGYIDGLGDKYTTYMTAEEWTEFEESALGNFVGIGVYMMLNENELVEVITPIQDSPAEKAGILAGDIIVKVNDENVIGMSTDVVSSKIKGEEGTRVKVQVKREDKYLDFELTRSQIKIYHVNSKILEDNIGYIQLITFDEGCCEEFNKKLMELKDEGVNKLIIDLRNNTGGIVDEALNIADMFIEKDEPLLITEDNKGNKKTTYAKTEALVNMNVVILTNGYTASSSEILTGALVDNKKATTVGTKTYGKGVIQQIFKLTDGGALKVTTEEYYTPNEIKIHGVGIKPDVEVELDKDNEETDLQLEKAIEILKK